MSAPAVYVTRPLPAPGTALLEEAGFDVRQQDQDRPATRDELLDQVAGVDALVSMLTDRVDPELLDAAPKLRVVANLAVGFDNVDVPAATERGVVVTNTPGVLTDATADLAFTLLLAAARRAGEGERLVRRGDWRVWGPNQLLGRPVARQTLGIVGMGQIGSAVARRARGFDMPVVYFNRHRDPEAEQATGARLVALDELLATSDFVSLHAPLNDESRHLIDGAALARMKPTAVLVNTARGALVDEAALVEALRAGTIAAAGLDVFEDEPAVHPDLLALDNVVLTPHIGSATVPTRQAMAALAVENMICMLDPAAGRAPPTLLNPELLAR
jgi:glyoxylate reductase